jgi:hypothetical protein
MGWCNHCNIYYKKLGYSAICNNCSRELMGTPPGLNNMMMQYYNSVIKMQQNEYYENKFRINANLMDLSSNVLLEHPNLIIKLAECLEDGHPPWYALLKAWYRKNKLKAKSVKNEKYPMKKLFELLKI